MTTDAQARALVDELLDLAPTNISSWRAGGPIEQAISKSLRAARPTWTDERPTEPGWYALLLPEQTAVVVEVVECAAHLSVNHPHSGRWIMDHLPDGAKWARSEMPEEVNNG